MKKIILLLICVALIVTSSVQMFPSVFATEEGSILTCDSIECAVGQKFTVKVRLKNNPGFNAGSFTPKFNHGATFQAESSTESLTLDAYEGCTLTSASSTKDYLDDELLTLTYTAPDEPGKYEIEFLYASFYNSEQKKLSVSTQPGIISVRGYEGTETDENGTTNWKLNKETGEAVISGNDTIVAPKWVRKEVKSVVINAEVFDYNGTKEFDETKEITAIDSNFFDGCTNLKEVTIFGDPKNIDTDTFGNVDLKKLTIKGFKNSRVHQFCNDNNINFVMLDEFFVVGHQKCLDNNDTYRFISRMRWSGFYDRAGIETKVELFNSNNDTPVVTATRDDEIYTVYKEINGMVKDELTCVYPNTEDGHKALEEDEYVSALVIEGFPTLKEGQMMLITFTPYVYNKYSEYNKISLNPIIYQYTDEGVLQPYNTNLIFDKNADDGKIVSWEKFVSEKY